MRGDGWERSSCCSFSTRGMSSWWVGEWGGSVVWDVEGCVFGLSLSSIIHIVGLCLLYVCVSSNNGGNALRPSCDQGEGTSALTRRLYKTGSGQAGHTDCLRRECGAGGCCRRQ